MGDFLSFAFTLPDAPVGYRGIGVGEFGVFFFRKVGVGLEILDPYYPFVVAAPGGPPVAGSVEEQVVAEVAQVISYPGSTRDGRIQAVIALQAAGTATAVAALKQAAGSSDVRARVFALSALLERGDLSILPSIEALALSSPTGRDEDLMMRVGAALGRVRDPRAIPALKELLNAPSVWVRRGAAAALHNMHDPKAVKPLASALFDSDQQVRYYGVVGLGEITGQNEWTPSIANFDQNEKKFLDHWREWARQNKLTE
jgi:HEAT repeat protein